MKPDDMSREDLSFRPDFASRVLDEADRVSARRERVMRASVLAAAFAVTGAFGVWSVVRSRAPAPAAPSLTVASAQTMSGAVAQSAQTEPLDYMFPEATPLAQFADEYSGAVSNTTTTRQNILFAGESGQDVENSD
jgi:hypothetical protein